MANYKIKSTNNRIKEAKEELDLKITAAEEVRSGAELPTAVAADRGKIFVVLGGAGVADTIHVCIKVAGGTYAWKAITIAS